MNPLHIAGAIALEQPKLGAMIVQGAYVQPLALTVTFQFSTTTINQSVEGTMAATPGSTASVLSSPFIVCDISYTVRRPNWMPGSVLREQSEYFNSLRPCVDLSVQFNGPRGLALSYTVAITETPIENLVTQYGNGWLAPWVIMANQAPTLNGTLRRTLTADEVPYIVSWTMLGRCLNVSDELLQNCRAMTTEDARKVCLSGLDGIAKALGG